MWTGSSRCFRTGSARTIVSSLSPIISKWEIKYPSWFCHFERHRTRGTSHIPPPASFRIRWSKCCVSRTCMKVKQNYLLCLAHLSLYCAIFSELGQVSMASPRSEIELPIERAQLTFRAVGSDCWFPPVVLFNDTGCSSLVLSHRIAAIRILIYSNTSYRYVRWKR